MKKKILEMLSACAPEYISGEDMCTQLNVSRAAVWKHIKKLQESGYQIRSSTKKGYALHSVYDPLDSAQIKANLAPFYKEVRVLESVDSTNEEMKRNACAHNEGDVLISDTQSFGKGRMGRVFHSPKHNGIYMSIFLRPTFSIEESLTITACTSCAIHDAIHNLYQLPSTIKWVNDIYMEDKKIGGILCEASLEMNTAQLEYMVLGIGINTHSYEMPSSLKKEAACIEDFTPHTLTRNALICEILDRFYYYYRTMSERTFLQPYRAHSYILGKEIDVHCQDTVYKAKAIDINAHAHLIVEREDGQCITLQSGEISIRKTNT